MIVGPTCIDNQVAASYIVSNTVPQQAVKTAYLKSVGRWPLKH